MDDVGAGRGGTSDVLIIGSAGVNAGTNLVGTPQFVAQHQQSFSVLHSLHVEVPLGSHPAMYGLADRYARISTGSNPFVDPQGFQTEISVQETTFTSELRRQQVEGPPAGRGRGVSDLLAARER